MKKNITLVENTNEIFKAQPLTIGVDLGDRNSHYCILDEAGNVILEQSVPTTPKGIQQVFSKISRSRIALETGTHSPWVSRLLTQLGHEVIVAHARNVQLNTTWWSWDVHPLLFPRVPGSDSNSSKADRRVLTAGCEANLEMTARTLGEIL